MAPKQIAFRTIGGETVIVPENPRKYGKRGKTEKRGYVERPGSGPQGETCKTCQHLYRNRMYSGKTFLKCGLNRAKWTGGAGSDILASAPACARWERADGRA